MTQTGFDFAPEHRPHKRVRETCVMGYEIGDFGEREAEVLRWLAGWWNRLNFSPTSAELLTWARKHDDEGVLVGKDDTWCLLYVRRGLSDLQTHRTVEAVPEGARECNVIHRRCETWRVKERGT